MVCIVSVMLGVATLIVVNAVMGGFSTKLRERLHGLLSDVVLEAYTYDGFGNYEGKIELIRHDPFLADKIIAMAPTLESFAMIQFGYNGNPFYQRAQLIGIELESRSAIGGFAEHIVLRKGKPQFILDEVATQRVAAQKKQPLEIPLAVPPFPGQKIDAPEGIELPKVDSLKPIPTPPPSQNQEFVPEFCILGHAMAFRRVELPDKPAKDICLIQPGDDVVLTTITGGRLSPVFGRFTVCDYFKSDMSEYDSNYVYVPLSYLQKLRSMEGRVTSIQIRLKDERNKQPVVDRLKYLFGDSLQVMTWEDKQGPLLAAISIEKGILNVLLFLIIAVAGFGILAIFSMIVVEKTRDIGILKALGASNSGVLQIFLGYGLLLGLVGALFGSGLGLLITAYVNEIEATLSWATGLEVFPRKIYYFDRIPTDIQTYQVVLINVGAIGIAVLFSVLPALRAALLHPVRALRYE
ncbi:MAG: ABC transporter permease [Planctomycetia bacterium]|nr:ABC transporter permease [Planctomycetia bacterium]